MEESDDGSIRFPALGCRSRSSSSVGNVADLEDINDMLPMLSDDDADHSVPLGEKQHGDIVLPYEESHVNCPVIESLVEESNRGQPAVSPSELQLISRAGVKRSPTRLRTKTSIETRLEPITVENVRAPTQEHPWVWFYHKTQPEDQIRVQKK